MGPEPSRLTQRLLAAVATRPAAPGLLVAVGLLAASAAGWKIISVTWFWPACAAAVLLAVGINTVRQDVWRRVQRHEHRQRMDTANALLNDHPVNHHPVNHPVLEEEPIFGSIRELGGLVERFGHKLDDLLTEVHGEKSSAEQRSHRS